MKILLGIPHVFSPKKNSLYSSQKESKRKTKEIALEEATIGNINRHKKNHWVHASLGKGKPIITREFTCSVGADITIQVFTHTEASLTNQLPTHQGLEIINADIEEQKLVPLFASKSILMQAKDYDLIGYMEDDLLIEDPEFFKKLLYLDSQINDNYAFLPHRCEHIKGKGDVILSGDPDGGRPDLFWDTGESIKINWPLGNKKFYRATNPHSGCYFLSQRQALKVVEYWERCNWQASFQLSGPLEQAASGMLLPVLKVMKPIPSDYKFLMVRHLDELWKRHPFELN